ncbi:MAG: hypothetical protein Q9191_002637 [Dirinaria sp. TL-2023a]
MAQVQWPDKIDTVVIGNGPSALILSFILHGNIPYYDNAHPHPDPILHQKLRDSICLLDIDVSDLTSHFAASRISYSTQALPINVLLDTLIRPLSDIDPGEHESCIKWRYEPQRRIEHVVLGNTADAGGQWADNPIVGSWDIGALSYTEMLSLPGYSLMEHLKGQKEMVAEDFDRPSRRMVAEYLKIYPRMVGIDGSIYTNTNVEGISRSEQGFHIKSHDLRCRNLVLASGTFSNLVPARPLLQPLLRLSSSLGLNDFPRLVVGSGFTAADVVLSIPANRKVLHIFKWAPDENPSPLKACHPSAYPEYASVYKEMKLAAKQALGSERVQSPMRKKNNAFQDRMRDVRYEGLPNTCIKDVDLHGESATVTLEDNNGQIFNREISHLEYVIGRRGSLEYLDQGLLFELLGHSESTPSSLISGKTLRTKVEESLEVAPNVFVIGSLTGDSLIRFAFGACLYAAREIMLRSAGDLHKAPFSNGDVHGAVDKRWTDNGSSTISEKENQESGMMNHDYNGINDHTNPAKNMDIRNSAKRVRKTMDASQHPSRRLSGCTIS